MKWCEIKKAYVIKNTNSSLYKDAYRGNREIPNVSISKKQGETRKWACEQVDSVISEDTMVKIR